MHLGGQKCHWRVLNLHLGTSQGFNINGMAIGAREVVVGGVKFFSVKQVKNPSTFGYIPLCIHIHWGGATKFWCKCAPTMHTREAGRGHQIQAHLGKFLW